MERENKETERDREGEREKFDKKESWGTEVWNDFEQCKASFHCIDTNAHE